MISFLLPGRPIPKPRMTQRDKYEPSAAARRYWAWANELRLVARKIVAGGEFLQGPLSLSAMFYLPIPTGWNRKSRQAALEGRIGHIVRPDLKNLVAGLEDACNGVLWQDDSQIVEYGIVRKVYDAEPHTGCVVQAIDDMEADLRALKAAQTLYLQSYAPGGAGH